jgi:predicted RNA-binding Zn-ribbon protein involved in translation (DUF1610 family)
MHAFCAAHKYLLTLLEMSHEMRMGAKHWENAMHYQIAPSSLPSLFLPCPHCGDRMAVVAVEPAPLARDTASNDLEDVTHGCEQCGTTVIRTVRSLFRAA